LLNCLPKQILATEHNKISKHDKHILHHITWITMWRYSVFPLQIGGSSVTTTSVWGLFDCKAQSCYTVTFMFSINNMNNIKSVHAVKYKTNKTFGKTKRRIIVLYWILKSLASPWSRRNERWSSAPYLPLHIQRSITFCRKHKENKNKEVNLSF
jgi:hypothetical protein